MNLHDILNIKKDKEIPVEISEVYELEPYLVINDFIALKVERFSNSYDTTNPILVTQNGVIQGYLIFTKEKGGIEISRMTEFEFISFLTFALYSDYNNSIYKFKSNFLLVKSNFFLDYIQDYEKTSILWGGFSHNLPAEAPAERYKSNITSIEIGLKLRELDNYCYESCMRAIEQPYAFERFLKMYHLLELQFDYSVIDKIKTLSIPSDANKIGKILNEYSVNELPRLTELIENSCTNIANLEQRLSDVSSFAAIAEDIFINFGKSKQDIHLINLTKFRAVLESGSFSSANLLRLKVHSVPDHNKFIISLTAYWIYRIRCSIAHNKIGEYLLSWNDENFIVEFAEPLLKEVLIQYFRK